MTDTISTYIVLNQNLKEMDAWRIPNTVSMLGLLLGTKIDAACLGPPITDASGITHAGMSAVVIPVLSIQDSEMRDFFMRCKKKEKELGIQVFDFTLTAQNSKVYEDYERKLSGQTLPEQVVLGIAIIGGKKAVRSLCGSLGRWK